MAGEPEERPPRPEWVIDRAAFLSVLRAEPRSRRELAERLGTSRTTAYRVTTDLADAGLIERDDGDYRTTPVGTAMADASSRFRDEVETVNRLRPLLEAVDSPALAANAHRFADARVTVADESDPYAPTDRIFDVFSEATRIRGGRVSVGSRDAVARSTAAVHDGMAIEICYRPTTLATTLQFMADADDDLPVPDVVTLYVSESVPFTFTVYDDVATVTGHDEATSLPTVFVESAAPEARRWLERLYERCVEVATPFDGMEPEDLVS